MDTFSFNGKTYTNTGSAWVREDGKILGEAYCGVPALAPAVGRYAVELARAGDDAARRSAVLARLRSSLGNGVLNAVLTLAGDLRSFGAVLA